MKTTSNLIRQAESQGYLVFWTNGAYRFAPQGRDRSPAHWSGPFHDLDDCAHAAIAESDRRLAAFQTRRLFLGAGRIDDVLANLRQAIALAA